MMKSVFFLIGVVVLGLAVSCQSHTSLIQKSDVAIMTKDSTHMWILNKDIGGLIYQQWMEGVFGDRTKVYLIELTEFEGLVKTTKKRSLRQVVTNRHPRI